MEVRHPSFQFGGERKGTLTRTGSLRPPDP
jgi:hypothetical protein